MILIFTLSMTLTFTPFNQNQILWRGAKYWHVISWCVQRENHGQCSGNGDFFSWSFLSLFSLIISFLLLCHFSCAAAFVVTRPLGLEQIRRTKRAAEDWLFWVCGSIFWLAVWNPILLLKRNRKGNAGFYHRWSRQSSELLSSHSDLIFNPFFCTK